MFNFIKIAIIWCVTIVAAYGIWQICAARTVAKTDPQRALAYYPRHIAALTQQSENELKAGITLQDMPRLETRSRQLLRLAPVSDDPFLHLAIANSKIWPLAALQPEQKTRQRALFQEARRRRIFDGRALKHLLTLDLLDYKPASAIQHANDLMVMNPDNWTPYLEALTALYSRIIGRDIIDDYMVDGANWRYSFLQHNINNMGLAHAPNIAHSLKKLGKAGEKDPQYGVMVQRFLDKLIALQVYPYAYHYWKGHVGDTVTGSELALDTLVYDPTFAGLAGPKPFNWHLNRGETFFSEIDANGGLYLSFADPKKQLMLKQIRLLETGHYQIKAKANWDYKQRQGVFNWQVKCLPSGDLIADLPLDDANKDHDVLEAEFSVPPIDCTAQSLQITASPAQYSKRIWASMKSVGITKLATPTAQDLTVEPQE